MIPSDNFIDFTSAEVSIDASAARTWRTLTSETGALFMGAHFKTDWVVGHPITFEGEWNGTTYKDHGKIITFDQDHLLQFTQFSSMSGKDDEPTNYDLVSFELVDTAAPTTVTMRLGKPAGVTPPTSDELNGLTENLHQILGVLKERAEDPAG